ncbi:MAG: oxidoreductase, partial [Parasporobacterium sp.]|nr:oxidoreductase [Parasporobacterium sp.]
KSIGVKTIREIGKLRSFGEYLMMAEANFNLVLNSEARFAAADLQERLSMPSIEIRRLYQIDKIESQYKALANALGVTFDDASYKAAAVRAADEFRDAVRDMDVNFAVGEFMNGDPFEMALSLVKEGFRVSEIYGTIGGENYTFVEMLAELSPETKVFSNLDPSMIYYSENKDITFTIGKDAAYYNPGARHVLWHGDIQPYGYAGVRKLFEQLAAAAKEVG